MIFELFSIVAVSIMRYCHVDNILYYSIPAAVTNILGFLNLTRRILDFRMYRVYNIVMINYRTCIHLTDTSGRVYITLRFVRFNNKYILNKYDVLLLSSSLLSCLSSVHI